MTPPVSAAGSSHRPGHDALISAWQNARVVSNCEAYYRTAAGGVSSWNLRDLHMVETIDALSQHLDEGAAQPARLIVWAHNSHLGDARMTARGEHGELNVGQLMRQRHDGRTMLVGFSTYTGRVPAAAAWSEEGRDHRLSRALPGSYAALFHELGCPGVEVAAPWQRGRRHSDRGAASAALRGGVVYVTATERQSHYLEADLARQYDAVVHIDETSALSPLSAGTE